MAKSKSGRRQRNRPLKKKLTDWLRLRPAEPAFAYEIEDEPVVESPADYGLTAGEYQSIQQVSQDLHEQGAAKFVATLEKLVEQYPQMPRLWNYLGVAYEAAGRTADAQRIIEEIPRRFPDYLFGMISLGMLRLSQDRPDEIPQILGGTFILHELQHGRMTYHISEITAFYAFLGRYFLASGDRGRAARYLDALESLEPEHPLTQMLRSQMLLSLSELMLGDDDEA